MIATKASETWIAQAYRFPDTRLLSDRRSGGVEYFFPCSAPVRLTARTAVPSGRAERCLELLVLARTWKRRNLNVQPT